MNSSFDILNIIPNKLLGIIFRISNDELVITPFDVGNILCYSMCQCKILHMVKLLLLLRYLKYGTLYHFILDVLNNSFSFKHRLQLLSYYNVCVLFYIYFRFIYITLTKYIHVIELVNNFNNNNNIVIYGCKTYSSSHLAKVVSTQL